MGRYLSEMKLKVGDQVVCVTAGGFTNLGQYYLITEGPEGPALMGSSLASFNVSTFEKVNQWYMLDNEKPLKFLGMVEKEALKDAYERYGFLLKLSCNGSWQKVTTIDWNNLPATDVYRGVEVAKVVTQLYVDPKGKVSTRPEAGYKIINVTIETANGELPPGKIRATIK